MAQIRHNPSPGELLPASEKGICAVGLLLASAGIHWSLPVTRGSAPQHLGETLPELGDTIWLGESGPEPVAGRLREDRIVRVPAGRDGLDRGVEAA